MNTFCTSIHCIDGRIQEPIINFLKLHYNVAYIDTITEPGPCKILAKNSNKELVDSIIERVGISIDKHKSKLVVISGHHDCAGNSADKERQKDQIRKSLEYLKNIYPNTEIIGLWINSEWKVETV